MPDYHRLSAAGYTALADAIQPIVDRYLPERAPLRK